MADSRGDGRAGQDLSCDSGSYAVTVTGRLAFRGLACNGLSSGTASFVTSEVHALPGSCSSASERG